MNERTKRAERVVMLAIAAVFVLQGVRWLASGERPATGLLVALAAMIGGAVLAFGTIRLAGRDRG